MAIDINAVQQSPLQAPEGLRQAAAVARQAEVKAALRQPVDLRTAIRDIERVSETFNRRLSFSINEKLDQVVVKVIDGQTDKVIKEIPPAELQQVYERIREVIGLLVDSRA